MLCNDHVVQHLHPDGPSFAVADGFVDRAPWVKGDSIPSCNGHLGHLAASEETNYRREPKPQLAAAIERETKKMSKASRGRLPIVWRMDLVSACRNCEFARKCLGAAAVRADFQAVEDTTQGE